MVAGETERGDTKPPDRRLLLGLLMWYAGVWTWAAIDPIDRKDWLLENILALAAVAALVLTHRRFPFSARSYCLITLFLTLHAIGAHYTYAQVPFGFWLKETLALARNPFDRLVHFAFGALLASPMREVLVRSARVMGFWSYYLPASGILAQSGLFEVIEAVVAMIVSPELGTLYLGTQGDEWDAQKDMMAAFSGALLALTITRAARPAESAGAAGRQP